jgi:hypothetical protein
LEPLRDRVWFADNFRFRPKADVKGWSYAAATPTALNAGLGLVHDANVGKK